MGRVDNKKHLKKASLLDSAFHLFTTQGFSKTSIAEIAAKAGIAKGTFYLYFEDKYDIRNKLVTYESGKLFKQAHDALLKRKEKGLYHGDFTEGVLYIVDYILNLLKENAALLNFISKNLSWGVFREAMTSSAEEEETDFRKLYMKAVTDLGIKIREPEIMLFLIVELVGSTAYSSIIYHEPTDIETLKPYLHRTICSIIEDHTVQE